MATIEINFDVKSIRQAIKDIEKIKRKFKKDIPNLFLDKCLEWIMIRANEFYLPNIKMSSKIIGDISTRWRIERINSSSKRLVNDSDKAVFVEFGVGIVGETKPHPNSSKSIPKYEYNIKTNRKDKYGQWRFRVKENSDIDLVDGNYFQENDLITTSGSPANLYLYNAAMDLVSTGAYKQIWQETLKMTV